MGFWDWIFGKQVDERESPRAGQVPNRDTALEFENSTGVAVLEAPAGYETESIAIADGSSLSAPWWAPGGEMLLEPVAPLKPELSAEARAIENILISHFDGHDLSMPALLPVAERALAQLRDSDSGLQEIARTIADDPVMAGAVLRMANSVLYAGVEKISSLPNAVTRIGTKALKTLLMHESMRAAMAGSRRGDAPFAGTIWRRSLAGSHIMRGLAAITHVDEEDAALLGLIHDIGNVIVLRIVNNQPKNAREFIDLEVFEYLCHEAHQEFGELVANAWKLPATLGSLISDHHSFPPRDDEHRVMRLHVILSDMIAAMLGYAPAATYDLMNCQAAQDLDLSGRQDFARFLDELPDELERAIAGE